MRWWRKFTGVEHLAGELTAMTRRALRAEKNCEEALEREAGMRRIVALLVEPASSGFCQKVRLRDRAEADAFAKLVESDSGAVHGTLEAYRCPLCPRQPVSQAKFWHVRHRQRGKRGKGSAQYRETRPRGLGRINPAQMARAIERLGMSGEGA